MRKLAYLQLWEWGVIVFLIVAPVRLFIFEPFIVVGESMEPNYHSWDYLIIDKLSYRLREPKRGEVIIFSPPVDPNRYYIKRIIGLPGETIVLKDDKIYIFNQEHPQGFVLQESYLPSGSHYYGELKTTLKDNEYFVLGDNREESYDSRRWGPLKKNLIVGRVLFALKPLTTFVKLIKLRGEL